MRPPATPWLLHSKLEQFLHVAKRRSRQFKEKKPVRYFRAAMKDLSGGEKGALTCVVLIRWKRPSSQAPLLPCSQLPVSVACDIRLPHCTFSDAFKERSETCDKIVSLPTSSWGNPVSQEMAVSPQGSPAGLRHPQGSGRSKGVGWGRQGTVVSGLLALLMP